MTKEREGEREEEEEERVCFGEGQTETGGERFVSCIKTLFRV